MADQAAWLTVNEGGEAGGQPERPPLLRSVSLVDVVLKATPYIWVTWMTKLISGDASCEWSLWFRARHKFDKLSAGTDLSRWTDDHDALVKSRVGDLRLAHLTPKLEQGMTVQGRLVTLSGKPDIRYEFDGSIIFEDCKTGRRRDADHVQVLLYIWLHRLQTHATGGGRVVYPDAVVDVDVDRLGEVERDAIRLLRLCSADRQPSQRPSISECRSCNIGRVYCHAREDLGNGSVFVTDVF